MRPDDRSAHREMKSMCSSRDKFANDTAKWPLFWNFETHWAV